MPITPSCQSAPATAYARRARLSGGHASTWATASRRIRPSIGLALAVQLLERVGEPARFRLVLGEEQLERLARVPEAAGGVEARREPEADGARVDGSRIDAGALHERAQAGLRRAREGAEAGDGERPVLVDERDDVGDRREGDEVEVAARNLGLDAEQGLAELVDDAGSAELGERVLGRTGCDDRTVGQRLARPVVVGDDDVEAAFPRLGHLGDGRDPAVDGEDEPAPSSASRASVSLRTP